MLSLSEYTAKAESCSRTKMNCKEDSEVRPAAWKEQKANGWPGRDLDQPSHLEEPQYSLWNYQLQAGQCPLHSQLLRASVNFSDTAVPEYFYSWRQLLSMFL